MSTDAEEKLRQSVVAVRDAEGRVLGSGFFIGSDGSLLTCFHVVGDKETGKLAQEKYQIYFSKTNHAAECIFSPSDPKQLDIAVLRLSQGKLPDGAALLPLGKWEERLTGEREFRTLGFRSAGRFMGLYADGTIKGEVDIVGIKTPLLQLSPEAPGQEELRPGMSGAPVFYLATERIVGLITTRYLEKDKGSTPVETMPLAIPIEAIAQVWQPLGKRFDQQRLYDQVLRTLSPAGLFTPSRFEHLCEDLPEFFGVDCDTLSSGEPHQSLLEHLQSRRLLDTFIYWLQQNRNYSDVPDDELLALPTPYYDFVNREKERENVLKGSPYIVLDAPAGYGKTRLLKDIEIRSAREGWLCIYVQVPSELSTCESIATSIQEFIGSSGITSLSNPADMGFELGNQLREVKKQLDAADDEAKDRKNGIALLIDNLERMSDAEVDTLINRFIPRMQEAIKGSVSFRVSFAGRYVGQRLKSRAEELPLKVISLTPFEFEVVKETVLHTADVPYSDAALRAAHLMYTTGGHPGCMADILSEMNFTRAPDAYFQEHQKEHHKQVLSVAGLVRKSIPDDLRDIFDVLSVFRIYNYRLLQRILAARLINYDGDADKLEKALTATYLVKRSGGFIQDEIVRRLLAIRLRLKEPDRFIDLCANAKQIYEQDLNLADYRSESIAIEGLYQELQLGYYQGEQTLNDRAALRDRFFAGGGILERYLSKLIEKPDAPDIKANFEAALKDEHNDWEFQFAINFFLRGEQYTNEPYEEIIRQTESFFA